jgi:hypothetical protein
MTIGVNGKIMMAVKVFNYSDTNKLENVMNKWLERRGVALM